MHVLSWICHQDEAPLINIPEGNLSILILMPF